MPYKDGKSSFYTTKTLKAFSQYRYGDISSVLSCFKNHGFLYLEDNVYIYYYKMKTHT
jgi:hypothetical protein